MQILKKTMKTELESQDINIAHVNKVNLQDNRFSKRLYSIKEASIYLGRSPWTVAEMVRIGKFPYIPDGKRKFLDVQDLDRWIETNKKRDID